MTQTAIRPHPVDLPAFARAAPTLNLVGVTGLAEHGKDALYRLALAPRNFTQVSSADVLRGLEFARVVSAADNPGLTAAAPNFYRYFGQRKDPEVRKALQDLGMWLREHVDPCFLMDLALQEAHRIVDAGGRVAITNVRMVDEEAALHGTWEFFASLYQQQSFEGLPYRPDIRWRMTHYADEHHDHYGRGSLPVKGTAALLRVERLGFENALTPEQRANPTERAVSNLRADAVVRHRTLRDLRDNAERALDTLGVPSVDELLG